jgi:hypothetical protein
MANSPDNARVYRATIAPLLHQKAVSRSNHRILEQPTATSIYEPASQYEGIKAETNMVQ